MVQRRPTRSKSISELPVARQGIQESRDPWLPAVESRLEPASQSLPNLLTAEEVAEILRLSVRTVRRQIASGKLPIVRIGRAVRIRPEAVEALIDGE